MSKYEVKEVVCDYGVFENDELKLIVNNKKTADAIVTLLELDRDYYKELQKDLINVDETYIVSKRLTKVELNEKYNGLFDLD